MKTTLFLLLFIFAIQVQAQHTKPYNLGFENISVQKSNWPSGWLLWGTGGYYRTIDSVTKTDGNYSIRIESVGDKVNDSFGAVGYGIAINFTGKKVTMKGKMKTENVEGEFAGLMLRMDSKDSMLQFNNMWEKKILGTNDWTEYSIELPLDKDAKAIYIGAILNGTGKIWADDFSIFIDDKDIRTVVMIEPDKSDSKKVEDK